MKIKLGDLNMAFSLVSHAVARRTTLPVLTHVLLKAKGNVLELVANNLMMAIQCRIPVTDAAESAMTVPARLLTDYVKTLGDEEIDAYIDEKRMSLKIVGSNSEANIKGLGSDEFPSFPELPEEGSITLSPAALEFLIDRAIIAASTNEGRPVLTGILTEFEGNLIRMVAADGFRLSRVEYVQDWKVKEDTSALIPAEALGVLKKLYVAYPKDVVKMHLSEERVVFRVGDVTFASSTLPSKFPDYKAIIPTPTTDDVKVTFAPEEIGDLYRIVKTLGLFSHIMLLEIGNGKIMMRAVDTETGEGEAEIKPTAVTGTLEIGLDANLLKDVLAVARDGQSLEILMKAPTSPVLFKQGDNFTYVQMPMNISGK